MEVAQCFKTLGFQQMPQGREIVDATYEERRKKIGGTAESSKLARRLLEENYRACLRLLSAEE